MDRSALLVLGRKVPTMDTAGLHVILHKELRYEAFPSEPGLQYRGDATELLQNISPRKVRKVGTFTPYQMK